MVTGSDGGLLAHEANNATMQAPASVLACCHARRGCKRYSMVRLMFSLCTDKHTVPELRIDTAVPVFFV